MIFALETSCDETAAAVITGDGRILANVVSSQAELHARFGGVVPEVASRRHLELVSYVVWDALGVAGPGLEGCQLLVASPRPGHAPALSRDPERLEPPFLCLLASGGHTLLLDVRERAGFRRIGTTI